MAFDNDSVRSFDADGIMHVSKTPISKANVCGYLGNEIANWQELGLDPAKMYMLYRDPIELEKAALTFNNKPVLNKHVPFTVIRPPKEAIVGMTGDDAIFEYPYLYQSMTITDGAMQAGIDSNKHREISSSYYYRADMTQGVTPDGEAYDGVMRDIVCNHIAIVPFGRAGSDVLVNDEKPKGDKNMSKKDNFWQYLKGKLANDANPEEVKTEFDNLVKDEEEQTQAERDNESEAMRIKEREERERRDRDRDREEAKADDEDDKDEIIAKLKAEIADLKGTAKDSDEEIKEAVSVASDSIRREFKELREAERICQPFVGNLACDSASELYRATLKHAGVKCDGVHESALKPMVEMLGNRKSIAQDASPILTRDVKADVLSLINGGK